jgi:uncharacterized OB-fold protein
MSLEVIDLRETWIKPVPGSDPMSKEYFAAAAEGRFLIQRCPSCGQAQHYPRAVCVRCGATPEWAEASGRGRVYSFSVIRQAGMPGFAEEVPYVVALVDLEEGPRVMGNITDCDVDHVRIGAPVEAYLARVADEVGMPQWRLAQNDSLG